MFFLDFVNIPKISVKKEIPTKLKGIRADVVKSKCVSTILKVLNPIVIK